MVPKDLCFCLCKPMGSPDVGQKIVLSCTVIIAAGTLERPGSAMSSLVHPESELAVEALATGWTGVPQGALVSSKAIVQAAPEPKPFSARGTRVLSLA